MLLFECNSGIPHERNSLTVNVSEGVQFPLHSTTTSLHDKPPTGLTPCKLYVTQLHLVLFIITEVESDFFFPIETTSTYRGDPLCISLRTRFESAMNRSDVGGTPFVKIALIGDSGVGKSTLTSVLATGCFELSPIYR